MAPKCIINEEGLVVYNNGLTAIDTRLWTTQAMLTKKLKLGRNVINNMVRRGQIKAYYIEPLDITLIPNVLKISDLKGGQKKL